MHLQIADKDGQTVPVSIHFQHLETAARPTSANPFGTLTDMTVCSVHKGPCEFKDEKGPCIAHGTLTSIAVRNPKDAPNRIAARKHALAHTIQKIDKTERKQIWEQYFKISPKSKN